MILVHIDDVPGDCKIPDYSDTGEGKGKKSGYFVCEDFGFGVEREMKESGEKSGTMDINIGVGQLNECSITKSMDRASAILCQCAINGNSLGTAIIDFVEIGGGGKPGEAKAKPYLRYKLDRCFVKSWETSGSADDRPTETVAFYYNKIAFKYLTTTDGKTFHNGGEMSWDNVTNEKWTGKDADTGLNP
jgi:type VI secretion system secreted protein Hcp